MSTVKQIFKNFLPQSRPELTMELMAKLENYAKEAGVDTSKQMCIIGIRGFYNKGVNQRAIYDDAIFVMHPNLVDRAFNANTDPGAFKKNIAMLKAGVWKYKLGIHGLSKPKILQYEALVQDAEVAVTRDQRSSDFTGYFGINIHKGGYTKVSSLGCQTIHPRQWSEFIGYVKSNMRSLNQKQIKYILKDNA